MMEVVSQPLLIEYGGKFLDCYGLSLEQHLVSLAIGAGSMVVFVLFKLIPEGRFTVLGKIKM